MKLKINDLSKILGITSQTIRRYEEQGYLHPERSESNYRYYSENDITRMIQLRLFRKCGFSHEQIETMLEMNEEGMRSVAVERLAELDNEIKRLKFLRHWLKDNIQLLDTVTELDKGFVRMICPAMRYVIYGTDNKIFSEKERLETVHQFLSTVEEVQSMIIYRFDDILNNNYCPYNALAIKEMDIERLSLHDIINNAKYLEIYPSTECLYGKISFDPDSKNNEEKKWEAFDDFKRRADIYLTANNLMICGDTVYFTLGLFGGFIDYLVCMPVKNI